MLTEPTEPAGAIQREDPATPSADRTPCCIERRELYQVPDQRHFNSGHSMPSRGPPFGGIRLAHRFRLAVDRLVGFMGPEPCR